MKGAAEDVPAVADDMLADADDQRIGLARDAMILVGIVQRIEQVPHAGDAGASCLRT